MNRFKKNICTVQCPKKILFSWLLLFSLAVTAQTEEKKEIIADDTTEVTEAPAAEKTEGTVQDITNKYFSNRWDTLVIEQRNIPGEVVKKWKEDQSFWYANADIKKKRSKEKVVPEKENGRKGQKRKGEEAINEQEDNDGYIPVGQRSWFQTLLWIVIIAGFAGFLFIYLSGSSMGLFRKKKVKLANAEEEEVNTEDIFAINYQKEIDKAAAQGNHRLAIRLMFLRLLKNMSEKNIIRYTQDKTNLDYLLELQSTNHYKHFFRITRNYEYSWYGKFLVSEDAYNLIRKEFDEFDKELQ